MKELPVPSTRIGWVSALVLIILSFFLYYGFGYEFLLRTYGDSRIPVSLFPPTEAKGTNETIQGEPEKEKKGELIQAKVEMWVPHFLSSFAPQPLTIVVHNTDDKNSLELDTWSVLAGSCSQQSNNGCPQEDIDDNPVVYFCPDPNQTSTMCNNNANFGRGASIPPDSSIQRTLWVTANRQHKQTGTVCFGVQTNFSTDTGKTEATCLTPKKDIPKSTISNIRSSVYGVISAILLPPWANGLIPIWGLFYVFIMEDCISFALRRLKPLLLKKTPLQVNRMHLLKGCFRGVVATFARIGVSYLIPPLLLFLLLLALLQEPAIPLAVLLLVGVGILVVMLICAGVLSKKLYSPCLFHREESPIDVIIPSVDDIAHHLLSIEERLPQAIQSINSEQLDRIEEALTDLTRILEQQTGNDNTENLTLLMQQALVLPWSPSQLIATEEIAAWYREALSHLSREAFQQLLIADTEGRFISQMLTLLSKMLADAERNPEEQGKHRLQLSNGDFEDSLVASPIWAIRETGRPNFLRKWHSYMKDFPEYREALYRWLFKRKAGWAEEHFFTVILPAAGDSSQESVPLLCIYIKHMQEAGKWVEIPWKRILEYLMNTIDKSTHIPEKAWNVLKPGGTQDKFLWEVVEEKTPFGSEEARALHKWLQDILCIVPVSFFEPIAEKIFTSLEYYNLTDDEDFKKFADAYGRFKQPDGSLDGLREAWCQQGDSAGGVEKP